MNNNNSAGIYIHVPFCQRICIYCDFYVTTARKYYIPFTNAVIREMELSADHWKQIPIETIYFGGGTPSYLPTVELEKILNTIHKCFKVSSNSEVTLEANPGDLDPEKLGELKRLGINRLSIGVQSFNDADLKFLSRNHTADQALGSIRRAREYFDNTSLDLIFGLPGQTIEGWNTNLETASELGTGHISIYNLTYEERTHLFKLLQQKKVSPANEEIELDMFVKTIQTLGDHGYEHYEISNFAKDGFQSRHNRSYWQGRPYLGVGPSAHSFDGSSRWWNIRDLKSYCSALTNENNSPVETIESLTHTQLQLEYILLNFRQMKGIDLSDFSTRFGADFRDIFRKAISQTEDFLVSEDGMIRLNQQGLFLYNKICLEFAAEVN